MIIWAPVYIFDQTILYLSEHHRPIFWNDEEKPIYFLTREEAESIITLLILTEGEDCYDITKVEIKNDVKDYSNWEMIPYTDEEVIQYYGQDIFDKYYKGRI